MKVLLLAGGWSSEREISLKGAARVAEALKEKGHAVTLLDPAEDFAAIVPAARSHEVAFINMHGVPGEDGLFQALLERLGCPYQGADAAGSFLALHKAAARLLFAEAGLNVPRGVFLPRRPEGRFVPQDFRWPLFVKSNTGGSSLQLSRVRDEDELQEALKGLFDEGLEVLVEEAVSGREVTCGVLDGRALDPILIINPGEDAFFDYTNKYSARGAQEICPAPLPDAVLDKIRRAAETAHNCLGLRGCSRADFILTADDELYILEINTLPGMTDASLVPKEAARIGLSYADFVERLLELALERR